MVLLKVYIQQRAERLLCRFWEFTSGTIGECLYRLVIFFKNCGKFKQHIIKYP